MLLLLLPLSFFFGKLQCHAELILTRRKKSSLCLSAQLFGKSNILLMDWICHFFIQVFYPNWFSYRYIDFCQQALQFKGKLITFNSCNFSMNGKQHLKRPFTLTTIYLDGRHLAEVTRQECCFCHVPVYLWWKPLKIQLPSECSQLRYTCDI